MFVVVVVVLFSFVCLFSVFVFLLFCGWLLVAGRWAFGVGCWALRGGVGCCLSFVVG